MRDIKKHSYVLKPNVKHHYTKVQDRRSLMECNSKIKNLQIFKCISRNYEKSTTSLAPYEQGIIYPDGKCKVGIDLWRDLDRHDCSSHEKKIYRSFDVVMKQYWIIPIEGNYTKGVKIQC